MTTAATIKPDTGNDNIQFGIKLGRAEYERDRAVSAVRRLVRKGTDGRYRTSQHGDIDVTDFVRAVLEK